MVLLFKYSLTSYYSHMFIVIDNGSRVPPSEQQVPEPKIYTGSNVPGRSFKMLQAMTNTENAG